MCPLCQKTIINANRIFKQIDQWVSKNPMPPPYNEWKRTIFCNDCEKRSEVPFNFVYHKVSNMKRV